MKNKAVLSISFGTKVPEIRERNTGALEADYRADHPDCALYSVITNGALIRIIQKEGDPVYAVRESIARMVLEGRQTRTSEGLSRGSSPRKVLRGWMCMGSSMQPRLPVRDTE